jgi:hypothetical protein
LSVLERLEPVSERYATAPVAEAFTWSEAAQDFGDGEWYMVAFRSVRRAGADEARLTLHDELAHQEAAGAPGFVDYYKGPCAMDRTCLSFCLWQSRAEARAAAGLPAHVRAMGLLNEMYESYTLEFHRVAQAADGKLTFEPYSGTSLPEHVHVTGTELHPVPGALQPAPGTAGV